MSRKLGSNINCPRQVDPSINQLKKKFQEIHLLFIAPQGWEGRLQVSFKYYNEPFLFKLIFLIIILVKMEQNAPKIRRFVPFWSTKSENFVQINKTKCVCIPKLHLQRGRSFFQCKGYPRYDIFPCKKAEESQNPDQVLSSRAEEQAGIHQLSLLFANMSCSKVSS